VFKQRWYIVANSHLHNAIRIFSLDRIHDLKITETPFKLPQDFCPDTFFETAFGISLDNETRPCSVQIKAFGNKSLYLRSLPLHHSQQETKINGNESLFDYFLTPTFDFMHELLSHGDEIVVLTPEWFREEIKNSILNMNNLYMQS
jgi:predicted DNA-binding transcriptional regulator YafY